MALPAALRGQSAPIQGAPAGSGYEYAAGEVILPFAYSATPAAAPQPVGLDFSRQLNPDNSQVFIRIDGELFEFRSQWVINRGTVARYKGPDIDNLTRIEDGLYPNGMTACWFLGGMWYDEEEKKLYAPMHVEHDNVRRTYPFSRKIILATSTDKGRSWKYEGDIITSETYYYPYDFFKFSGHGFGIGVADFGFYADVRGGYFYVFPDEAWSLRAKRAMRWNSRAARCAIRDKMAPGKWNYFYNGKWEEPALGGKSSIVAPSHLWGVTYSKTLNLYVGMLLGNQDPPVRDNIDGIYIGACTDLGKQDWVWGHCPEAMFGFMNLINAEGTDVAWTCDDRFRRYAYFEKDDFQRLDIKLAPGKTATTNLAPRYLFEPHPESSEPMMGRSTKIVGCASAEMKYTGTWSERSNPDSYEDRTKESSTPNSSVEFSFQGDAVYWRAVRSPQSGRADVYVDGVLRKTVDCYSPQSTTCEQFLYLRQGLAPATKHTIKVVVSGKKHPKSSGAAVQHIAFEFSAESYKASAGFSGLMGKNHWHYQQWDDKKQEFSNLAFFPDEAYTRPYWVGQDGCQIGHDYQIAGKHAAVRKWVAPHGGLLRIEGAVHGGSASIWLNHKPIWPEAAGAAHDLQVTVIQGDAISFVVSPREGGEAKVFWDPVLTYTQSVPAIWKPNVPSADNLALNKYARSKVLVSHYRPFQAVDGDLNTSFTIHSDDPLSSGDDWLQVDLEDLLLVDRYVASFASPDAAYRPKSFSLQYSEDGLAWKDADSVVTQAGDLDHYYAVPMLKIAKDVPAFRARYVRLYFPQGKPFTISGFELYYTEGKTSFGPPIPAG